MSTIGIQFTKKNISIAYFNKGKAVGTTVTVEEFTVDSIRDALKKANISLSGVYNVVYSLPEDLIELNTLHSIPSFKNIKNKKQLKKESVEKVLGKTSDEHYITYIEDATSTSLNNIDIAIVDSKQIELLKFYNKLKAIRGINQKAIDIDAEALRRVVGQSGKNVVILHFYDSDKRNVGIYIYKGNFIIGARHLISELYSYEEIKDEIERAIGFSKTKYRDLSIDSYYVFGRDSEIEGLSHVINVTKHEYSNSDIAVAIGLAKKDLEKNGFNLLPDKFIAKSDNNYILIGIAIYLIVVSAFGLMIYNNYMKYSLEKENQVKFNKILETKRMDLDQLQRILKADPDAETYKDYVETDKKILTEREWIDYSDFTATISQIVTDIAYNKYEINLQKIESKDGAVILEGQSKSYDALNILFNKLKSIEKINNVKLEKMEVRVEDNVIIYSIKCDLDYKW